MSDSELKLRQQAIRGTLAKNLVLARHACGMTQADLAGAAGISRATVAQMESGEGDPRLSTVVGVATALGTRPMLLLLGQDELQALTDTRAEAPRQLLSPEDVETMTRLMSSGLRKPQLRAAELGARAARAAGLSGVGAAIGTGLVPGVGTAIGAAIGAMLGTDPKVETDS